MTEIIKEKFLQNSTGPLFIDSAKLIISQMENCVCKINNEDGSKCTGFFCKIPYPNLSHLLPLLITVDHCFSKDLKDGDSILLSLNNDSEFKNIKIDNNRKIFRSEEYDTDFIEIKPEDKINNFLEVDKEILGDEKKIEYIYKKKSLYIIHYLEGKKVCMNLGLFERFNEKSFFHSCNTDNGSAGGPILSLDNFKVIGVHSRKSIHLNFNIGSLINYPISDFIKQNK